MDPRLSPISDIKILSGRWHEPPMGKVSGTFVRDGRTEMFETGFLTIPDENGDSLDIFALDIIQQSEDFMPVPMSYEEEEVFRKTIKKWVNDNMLG